MNMKISDQMIGSWSGVDHNPVNMDQLLRLPLNGGMKSATQQVDFPNLSGKCAVTGNEIICFPL